MDTPDGYVDIKISVDINGDYEAEIVGRGKNTSCLTENDPRLVKDILEAKLAGYGDFGTVEDSKHTDEYWQEKKAEVKETSYVQTEGSFKHAPESATTKTPQRSKLSLED